MTESENGLNVDGICRGVVLDDERQMSDGRKRENPK